MRELSSTWCAVCKRAFETTFGGRGGSDGGVDGGDQNLSGSDPKLTNGTPDLTCPTRIPL
jgi:hypothetical protein